MKSKRPSSLRHARLLLGKTHIEQAGCLVHTLEKQAQSEKRPSLVMVKCTFGRT